MLRNRRGVTIIELFVAVVILSVLASIAVRRSRGVLERAYEAVVHSDLHRAWTTIEIYHATEFTYPPSAEAADFSPSEGIVFDAWEVRLYDGRPGMYLEARHENSAYEYVSNYPLSRDVQKRSATLSSSENVSIS